MLSERSKCVNEVAYGFEERVVAVVVGGDGAVASLELKTGPGLKHVGHGQHETAAMAPFYAAATAERLVSGLHSRRTVLSNGLIRLFRRHFSIKI